MGTVSSMGVLVRPVAEAGPGSPPAGAFLSAAWQASATCLRCSPRWVGGLPPAPKNTLLLTVQVSRGHFIFFSTLFMTFSLAAGVDLGVVEEVDAVVVGVFMSCSAVVSPICLPKVSQLPRLSSLTWRPLFPR